MGCETIQNSTARARCEELEQLNQFNDGMSSEEMDQVVEEMTADSNGFQMEDPATRLGRLTGGSLETTSRNMQPLDGTLPTVGDHGSLPSELAQPGRVDPLAMPSDGVQAGTAMISNEERRAEYNDAYRVDEANVEDFEAAHPDHVHYATFEDGTLIYVPESAVDTFGDSANIQFQIGN